MIFFLISAWAVGETLILVFDNGSASWSAGLSNAGNSIIQIFDDDGSLDFLHNFHISDIDVLVDSQIQTTTVKLYLDPIVQVLILFDVAYSYDQCSKIMSCIWWILYMN